MKPGPRGEQQERVRALLAATPGGMTGSEVAAKLALSPSAASSTLRRLEQQNVAVNVGHRARRGRGRNEVIYALRLGAPAFDPLAAARRRNRHHTGMSARIRAALAAGPLTALELAERLGTDQQHINNLVTQLTTRMGGVMAVGAYPTRYQLYRAEEKPESALRAQRITIGRGFANWPGQGRVHG